MPDSQVFVGDCLKASDVLDAIDTWACGMVVVREFEGLGPCVGRLDAVLVPVSPVADCMQCSKRPLGPGAEHTYGDITITADMPFWERPCVIGVEVKVSRTDFLAGQRKGQYERYQSGVSGLYVAAPADVCKTTELPKGVGRLMVKASHGRVSVTCKRHPKYKDVDLDPSVPWRLMFRLHRKHVQELRKARYGY